MFSHLVESDLHKDELKRRGTFFLATMAAYALLLMAASVGGVYAYEARIDDQSLELVALVPPEMEETKPREAPPKAIVKNSPSNTSGPRNMGGPAQPIPSNTSSDPTKISGAAQTSTNQTPPTVPEGGNRTYGFGAGLYNPNGDVNSSNNTAGAGGKIIDEEPPRIVKQPEATEKRIASIGVVNSRALNLPEPVYPQLAKTARIQGIVNVEILIDETGRVISAHATTGNPLLRQEAERAASRARFSPTLLSQQPVKAKGVITFNFILR